jgi:hypothetical protein
MTDALDHRVVWKYPFDDSDEKTFEMPTGATVLHFDEQHNAFCLWVLVDPQQASESRQFRIIGTGYPVFGEDELRHIGTALVVGGAFVWHCFEVIS